MALKIMNFDGDIILGEDTRNEFSSFLGNGGYAVFGRIRKTANPDIIEVYEGVSGFVGGLYFQNTQRQEFEVLHDYSIVVETSYDGERFGAELKVVSHIDETLVNGVKKHFAIYRRNTFFEGKTSAPRGLGEECIFPVIKCNNGWIFVQKTNAFYSIDIFSSSEIMPFFDDGSVLPTDVVNLELQVNYTSGTVNFNGISAWIGDPPTFVSGKSYILVFRRTLKNSNPIWIASVATPEGF